MKVYGSSQQNCISFHLAATIKTGKYTVEWQNTDCIVLNGAHMAFDRWKILKEEEDYLLVLFNEHLVYRSTTSIIDDEFIREQTL